MTTKLPGRRVNPIKVRRQAYVAGVRPPYAPVATQGDVYRPNYWLFALLGLILVYAVWMTVDSVSTKIENARLEGRQEVQQEVIEDLRSDRDKRAETDGRQSGGASIADLLHSIIAGILTVINAIVGVFVDVADDTSRRPA